MYTATFTIIHHAAGGSQPPGVYGQWAIIHLLAARPGCNLGKPASAALTCVQPQLQKGFEAMFARWQKQKRPNGNVYLVAQLVTTAWTDGASRQKHLAYLGGIAEAMISDAEARQAFWTKAKATLAALKLKPAERQKVEASLEKRVPPATKAQLRQQYLRGKQQELMLAERQVQKLRSEVKAARAE
jgi:hypothetical protein